jgi:hypothetical protein
MNFCRYHKKLAGLSIRIGKQELLLKKKSDLPLLKPL